MRDLRRRLEEVRVHERNFRILLVGGCPGERLVQDAAERIDVGAPVELATLDLLGRGVVGRADEHSRLGQGPRSALLGDAEVGEVDVIAAFRPVSRHDQDVGRLHVAVDEPLFLVRRIQGARHLAHDGGGAGGRKRPVRLEDVLEGGAADEAHCDVEDPALVPRLVDRDDVRVVEGRGQSRFACEALLERVVLAQLGHQDFERHCPLQPEVLGAVHHAHAPGSDQLFEPVARKLRSDLWHPA